MKRPLVKVALFYGAGLLFAQFLPLPATYLFGLASILVVVALTISAVRPWLLPAVLFSIGWTNLTLSRAVLSPHDLRELVGERTVITNIRGRLAESPTQRVYERDDETATRSLARMDVEEVRFGDIWHRAYGRIAVSVPGILSDEFFMGRRIEVDGVLGPPRGPLAPGLFDYRAHLRDQGIQYSLRTESSTDWQLLDADKHPRSPLADRFRRWAQLTLARGLPHQDESLELVWAMVLGWQTALTNEVSEPFMRSGTMHIFAISGLHIALIAGMLVAIARTLQVPRGICGLVVIPLLWFYTAATGWQSSAIRSTIMMTIVIAGWALKRPSDLINCLAGAAFIILLWNPLQLFQASFQLSFFVVLSIALFMAPLEKWLARLWQPDPLLPAELRPRWQRWLGRPLRWLVASFATSLAAWLGSLPLTAYYFHLFNPVSLLANLAIVPLSGLALMCGMGSLLCGDWLPWVGELFNHSAWFWMKAMVWLSEWAASLRLGWWYVAAPGIWFFAFYYTSLIATLAGGFKRAKLRPWLAALVLLLGFGWGMESWQARRQTSLSILPLNGGHALFLDQPGRADDWLVDTGDSSSCEFVTIPFLRAKGVNRLAHLALTQGDVRQMGGAAEILAGFSTDELVTSSAPSRSPNYRKLTTDLASSRQTWRKLNRGDAASPWRILHPDASDHFTKADDNALVLAAQLNGVRVLLLSDLGREGQESLMRREPDLRADIVIAGLPARDEPLCDALLEAVNPKLIVIVDSEFPATRRAPALLRDRLAQRGVTVLYTRETGAVVVDFKNSGWMATPMIPAQAKSPNLVN